MKNSWKIMKHASETHCIICASKVKLQFLNTVKRNIKIAILSVLAALQHFINTCYRTFQHCMC